MRTVGGSNRALGIALIIRDTQVFGGNWAFGEGEDKVGILHVIDCGIGAYYGLNTVSYVYFVLIKLLISDMVRLATHYGIV